MLRKQERLQGALMIVGGIGMIVASLSLFMGLSILIESQIGIGIGLAVCIWPFSYTFKGWLQLLTGLCFAELSEYFDSSSSLKKVLLSTIFIVSSIVFALVAMVTVLKLWTYIAGDKPKKAAMIVATSCSNFRPAADYFTLANCFLKNSSSSPLTSRFLSVGR